MAAISIRGTTADEDGTIPEGKEYKIVLGAGTVLGVAVGERREAVVRRASAIGGAEGVATTTASATVTLRVQVSGRYRKAIEATRDEAGFLEATLPWSAGGPGLNLSLTVAVDPGSEDEPHTLVLSFCMSAS